MTMSQGLICMGLGLDIVGVILLYRYGLPSRYPEDGISLIWPGGDSDPKEQNRFKNLSRSAIILLILGFVLQIVGTILV